MEKQRTRRTASRTTDLPLLILGTIAFMYFTAEVLKPLAIAVLLSFALTPLTRFFERRGLPRVGSVVLSVVLVLGALGGVGYVVGKQLTSLALHLPEYRKDITSKVNRVLSSNEESVGGKVKKFVTQVTRDIETADANEAAENATIQRVELVSSPSFLEQVRGVVGPYLEGIGMAGLVFVLVLFMLMGREQLRDRIVGLFGKRHISLTTRTMEEIGQRISRYLGSLALVNSCVGLVIGCGLGLIGLPYAALWGCMAALLRFIPYVGPAIAFFIPMTFSIAHFPGWLQPAEVLLLYAVLEVTLASYLEPIVYGKSTGLSALGLLIAAMFWTWMWGTTGLLLSTPLTVCLAVMGKYLPSLRFFAILLDEQSELGPDVRLYQRLIALDRDGAVEVVEGVLKDRSHVQVFDEVLVPTLTRVEIDAVRGELDENEQEYVLQMVSDAIDWVGDAEEFSLETATHPDEATHDEMPLDDDHAHLVMGIGVQDASDTLVLRMLGQLLEKSGVTLEQSDPTVPPLKTADEVAELDPKLIVLSHLPPQGLSMACYRLRRLRARFPAIPIVACRWGSDSEVAQAESQRLMEMGATHVVRTIAEARERILRVVLERAPKADKAVPLPG